MTSSTVVQIFDEEIFHLIQIPQANNTTHALLALCNRLLIVAKWILKVNLFLLNVGTVITFTEDSVLLAQVNNFYKLQVVLCS